MLSQYEPTVKTTIEFLRMQKIKVNEFSVNEALQNHPDWPSLLCISDALNKWNIPHGAGKVDVSKLDELPTPFIAVTTDKESPMVVVTDVTPDTVSQKKSYHNKITSGDRSEFIRTWDGVYLIAEALENSGEPDFGKQRWKHLLQSAIPVAALITFICFSILLLSKNIALAEISSSSLVISIYAEYLIMLIGLIVTSMLLWYEIDKNNPLLKKVCTGISNSNCKAILTGKNAKLFRWLSWSEVGFFYFIGGMLSLLLSNRNLLAVLSLLALLNVLAAVYPFFSIYYQWKVAKQWCVLCLAVQALILLGLGNALINLLSGPLTKITYPVLAEGLLAYLLSAVIWFTIKPYILQLQEAKNIKRAYLRIKFNTEIFDSLLKRQKKVTQPVDELGIDLGNPMARNTLLKVCNPYCGPCSKAHPKIEKLLEELPNIKVKIIFTTPNVEIQPAVKPVGHLLAIAENNEEEKVRSALDSWYLADPKDYDQFALKFPLNGELSNQGRKIDAMYKWCVAMDISFTPTIFINGYQLPDAYDVEDLQYFLLD